MKTIIVRTTCTAVVRERWEIEVPDGADINQQSFEGSGGWNEAIEQGRVRLVKHDVTHVDEQRDREVLDGREEGCSCVHHGDGSITTMLCSQHAKDDPCRTMAAVTGRRRRGSIVRGACTACGWSETERASLAHAG